MDASKLAAAGREAAAIDAEIGRPAPAPAKGAPAPLVASAPAELPQQGGAEELPMPADPEAEAREWGMIAYSVGQAAAMFAPALRQVYSEEACAAWGATVVPVARKYGFGGPGKIPELGLALSTISLAVPTVFALRARLAELDAQARAEERRQGSREGQAPDATAPAPEQPRAPFTPAPLS
ncbi:MAG TPA: hypothetical protein VGE10_01705 [Zeimonas sp.]